MRKDDKFHLIWKSINTSDVKLSVSSLCKMAGVSRSGYYQWLSRAEARAAREAKDRADFGLILEAYNHRGYDKGCRGIYMRLLRLDVRMNVKKIRRLMRLYNLYCTVRKANPYRQRAKASDEVYVVPNALKREFLRYGARKVLLTDVTYIKTNEGFYYLSTIIDAYTRQILAYEVSKSFTTEIAVNTINNLMRDYGDTISNETMIHSDQGFQYKSADFVSVLAEYGLKQSMSRKGNCWDNAPQESFFGHMKDSIRDRLKSCETLGEVQKIIDDWMDFYNNERYQWQLGGLSPNEYYEYITAGILPEKLGSLI